MNARSELGKRGEAAAAAFLENQGYRIRARNYRCHLGEIDLVATSGEFLVFIEVKTRASGGQVHPSASVTRRKQAKVRQVGEYFWAHHPEVALQPRFDVVSVDFDGGRERVEHIVNAF